MLILNETGRTPRPGQLRKIKSHSGNDELMHFAAEKDHAPDSWQYRAFAVQLNERNPGQGWKLLRKSSSGRVPLTVDADEARLQI